MKKFLSLMLAVLMLAGAVSAMAETVTEEAVSELAQMSFAKKYTDEGQRLVTNISIEPGIVLLASVDEEMQTPLQDLLHALTIQIVGQKTNGSAQGSLRFYLGEDVAADAIVAVNKTGGIYAASGFLGNTILQVTPAQMKELAKTYAQQMIANGQMTQEQYDAVVAGIKAFREDPRAAIRAMMGEMDTTALKEALYGLLNFELSPQTLTEVPEETGIQARYLITVPVKKDALRNVTTELAKLIWSMPVVQQIAPSVTINGDAELTEENLAAMLNAIPDALAEDLELRLYTSSLLFTEFELISDVRLNIQGREIPMKVSVLGEETEAGMHTLWMMGMDLGGRSSYNMMGDMLVTPKENGATVRYEVTAEMRENGEIWTPIYETVNADISMGEEVHIMDMEVLARAKQNAEADPLGLIFSVSMMGVDLGDHMQQETMYSVAMENIGDIVSIYVNQNTDLAEAYIITDNAVQPAEMTEEELNTLGQKLSMTAMMGVVNLVQKLPESVRPLAQQLLGMQ